jgi:hypothetical protein
MFNEVKKVRQRSISITVICFFLLLLFLPSIARCSGWVTTDQGEKVSLNIWMDIVSPQNTTAQWSGAKDAEALATGSGILKWFNKDKLLVIYQGEMLHGKYNGRGSLTLPDGLIVYEGTFVNGYPHGRGIH